MDANRPRRVQTHIFPGCALRPRRRDLDSSAEALSARWPWVLDPLPAARPNHSRGFTANNPCFSRLLSQESGPRDKLQRGELEGSSPSHSGLSPQKRSLESWGTNACRVSPPFSRLDWIFVVAGPRQVQNDEFHASGAKKHRIRWWPQDPALDLTPAQCAPFPRRQTKSSPVCATEQTDSGPNSTTWRAGPYPPRSLGSAPQATSKAWTAKAPYWTFL